MSNGAPPAADVAQPLLDALLGGALPVRIELWDGSVIAPEGGSPVVGTLRILSPDALRRILWCPNELGLGRAYVAGEIEADGEIVPLIEAVRDAVPKDSGLDLKTALTAARDGFSAARRLGVLGRPLPPPPQEVRHLHGWRHSLRRDAEAVSHHYDVGNDFYRIVLGPTMVYSCARFVDDDSTLDEAQTAKLDLVARKLGLHERTGARLLDVGCGWGSMAIHAAQRYNAQVVGITISREQAELARERVKAAGVDDRVDIRLQDYRDLRGERFEAISSIGMSEHVGSKRLDEYFGVLRAALVPTGRLLNHAISSVGGSRLGRHSFVGRYVFPDGELIDVGDTVLAMERAGFEVRDTESLREHYARTLRAWVSNLEANWDDAVAAADVATARIWRLYMAGSVLGFTDGGISVHQVLGVVPTPEGTSAMPPTRTPWL